MITLAELVRVLREQRGWNQETLAKESGLGQTAIGNIEAGSRGAKGRMPPSLPGIAKAFGMPTDDLWSLVGKDRSLLEPYLTAGAPDRRLPVNPNADDVSHDVTIGSPDAGSKGRQPTDVVIPQYRAHGSMGRGLMLRDQPGVIHSWSVSREWVHKNVKNATAVSNLCIVTGFGDSMRPLYNPGDPLLVDHGVKSVEFDAIYFFRVGDEGFIKRLQRIPGVGLVALSENKAYKDWTITEDMDFEVFGRVLKLWRGEDY